MNLSDIKEYLSKLHLEFDDNIKVELLRIKEAAILKENEPLANEVWCIEQVYKIQKLYVSMYNNLKQKQYKEAWYNLERIDIELSFLRPNFDYTGNKYNMYFIECVIKHYTKLFPYQYFMSREAIIKSEECSICGKKVSIRGGCKHRVGKLYMGEMCGRKVTEYEFLGMAMVKNPFDKYGVIHLDGVEYNYYMLESLMKELESPYDHWYVEELKMVSKDYADIDRNDKCPCGSGLKYKKCCINKEKELTTHYKVTLLNGKRIKETPRVFVGTWKK